MRVRAGVHHTARLYPSTYNPDAEHVVIDLLDKRSLNRAMVGVETVYHFAALRNTGASKEDLFKINVEGTRNVWECAAESRLRTGLYCSSTAVYGLLSSAVKQVSEERRPRAFESYGRSKLIGETVALEIGVAEGVDTVVIRPVAVFGPSMNVPAGMSFQNATFSSFLLARIFRARMFSFVHVEDVAEAAVHLMHSISSWKGIFNVAADEPISVDEALEAYIHVLERLGRPYKRAKFLGWASAIAQELPFISYVGSRHKGKLVSTLFRPEYYVTYSSNKLLDT